ncbi:uncharacterized protein LOC118183174 [Stegodyphus dumicola]|uniref:uncharacterized protein LOC118183174 n=1 Tax=Stegodyphus dumicola TaxID=202533 RepID=UPI0015B1E17E|nr:uncharacterized protein LOC118183174 [Stegodyphus dumicola]
MDLEKLKKKRSAIRAVVTRLINKIETEIANERDENVIEEMVAQLISKEEELILADNGIETLIDVANLEDEIMSREEYENVRIIHGSMTDIAKVIDKYLKEGIAEETNIGIGPKTYFMPHQAVIRENKETTNLSVVFDASSHAENCLSLNDCLHSGPKMYPDILKLLRKFRQNRIAFTAEIKQAFLQISLAEENRNAVKFLWNDGELNGTKTKALRMTRVIFGATSSPFLLRATLNVHADKYKSQYPNVFSMLAENMYVDDLIAGADEESKALEENRNILNAY